MASGETEWAGTLPEDGDYKIFVLTEDRVKAPFILKISVRPTIIYSVPVRHRQLDARSI